MNKQLKTILLGLAVFAAVIAGIFVVYTVQNQGAAPVPTPVSRPSPAPTAQVPQIFEVSPDDVCALSFSVAPELVPGLNCVSKELYKNDTRNLPGTYFLDAANKLGSDTVLTPGETYVYVINYENTGTGATAGEIVDVLPQGLKYLDADDNCSHTASTRTVTCELDSVAAEDGSRVAIRFEVEETIGADSITNKATLTPTVGDASTCSLSSAIKTPPPSSSPSASPSPSPSPSPTLEASIDCITKRAYLDNASNSVGNYYLNSEITNTNSLTDGQTVVFNVAIKNNGAAAAPGVKITDTLSSNLTYLDGDTGCTYSAEARTVTCDVGTVSANTETSRSFRARISAASTTAIANTADVTSSNGQRDSCSITINAAGQVVAPPSPVPTELPEAGIFEVTVGTLGIGVLLLIVGALGLLLI